MKDEFEKYKEKNKDNIDTYKLHQKFKKEHKQQEIEQQDKELWREFDEGQATGEYQLISVITHKGRSTDSGHYVAWCHQTGDTWIKYDDDLTSEVTTDEVMNLKGGGDWHMAYFLIYRRKQFKE